MTIGGNNYFHEKQLIATKYCKFSRIYFPQKWRPPKIGSPMRPHSSHSAKAGTAWGGERCEFPGLGWSPCRNWIWCILALKYDIVQCGNNFNDFPETRLTKFRAVYTVKVNLKYWGKCPMELTPVTTSVIVLSCNTRGWSVSSK